ncbi:hypothetical protein EDD16DRAFT_1784094 [Pisolithus croceorrhizus]|nr:hypothetical protein EDD16DRAFT_1784094 [Pisolithus croceorrhizus]
MSQPKEIGTLVVVVLKARHLHQPSFYKQDPYAQVTLCGPDKKTNVAPKGGQHPEWDDEFRFPFMRSPARIDRIEWHSRYRETLKTGEFDDWVQLETSAGARGEVYLEMTFYANSPPPPTRRPSKLIPDRLARPVSHYTLRDQYVNSSNNLPTPQTDVPQPGRLPLSGPRERTSSKPLPSSMLASLHPRASPSSQPQQSSSNVVQPLILKQKDELPPVPGNQNNNKPIGKKSGHVPTVLRPGRGGRPSQTLTQITLIAGHHPRNLCAGTSWGFTSSDIHPGIQRGRHSSFPSSAPSAQPPDAFHPQEASFQGYDQHNTQAHFQSYGQSPLLSYPQSPAQSRPLTRPLSQYSLLKKPDTSSFDAFAAKLSNYWYSLFASVRTRSHSPSPHPPPVVPQSPPFAQTQQPAQQTLYSLHDSNLREHRSHATRLIHLIHHTPSSSPNSTTSLPGTVTISFAAYLSPTTRGPTISSLSTVATTTTLHSAAPAPTSTTTAASFSSDAITTTSPAASISYVAAATTTTTTPAALAALTDIHVSYRISAPAGNFPVSPDLPTVTPHELVVASPTCQSPSVPTETPSSPGDPATVPLPTEPPATTEEAEARAQVESDIGPKPVAHTTSKIDAEEWERRVEAKKKVIEAEARRRQDEQRKAEEERKRQEEEEEKRIEEEAAGGSRMKRRVGRRQRNEKESCRLKPKPKPDDAGRKRKVSGVKLKSGCVKRRRGNDSKKKKVGVKKKNLEEERLKREEEERKQLAERRRKLEQERLRREEEERKRQEKERKTPGRTKESGRTAETFARAQFDAEEAERRRQEEADLALAREAQEEAEREEMLARERDVRRRQMQKLLGESKRTKSNWRGEDRKQGEGKLRKQIGSWLRGLRWK